MPLTLHVFVDGRTPYEVEDQRWAKAADAVALEGSIPVEGPVVSAARRAAGARPGRRPGRPARAPRGAARRRALTDEEFAAQKQRVLGDGRPSTPH